MERPIGARHAYIVTCIEQLEQDKTPKQMCETLENSGGEAAKVMQESINTGMIDSDNFSGGAEHIVFACSLDDRTKRIMHLRLVYEYLSSDLQRQLRHFLGAGAPAPSIDLTNDAAQTNLSTQQEAQAPGVSQQVMPQQAMVQQQVVPQQTMMQQTQPAGIQAVPNVQQALVTSNIEESIRRVIGELYEKHMLDATARSAATGVWDPSSLFPLIEWLMQFVVGNQYLIVPTLRLKSGNYQHIVHAYYNDRFIDKLPPGIARGGSYKRVNSYEIWVRLLNAVVGDRLVYKYKTRVGIDNKTMVTHQTISLTVGADWKLYRFR